MVSKREAKKELLKEKLFKIAQRQIRERGVSALRARDITSEAECALGSLYSAYKDLDTLVLLVNSNTLSNLDRSMETAAKDIHAPVEKLTALALGYARFAKEEFHLWSALFEHKMPVGEPVPEWHLEHHLQLLRHIVNPISELRGELDREALLIRAKAVFAAVHGIVKLSVEDRFVAIEEKALEGQLREFVETVALGWSLRHTDGSRDCVANPE